MAISAVSWLTPFGQCLDIDQAAVIDRQLVPPHPERTRRGTARLSYRRVFDCGADHRRSGAVLRSGTGRDERAEHGQVGRLRAAGGEDDVARIAPESFGYLVAGFLQQAPGSLRRPVTARRIAERDRARLGHGLCHLGPQRRGGGVVEIRRGVLTHEIQNRVM